MTDPRSTPLEPTISPSYDEKYKATEWRFPEWLRQTIIPFPASHATFGWACDVENCEGILPLSGSHSLCLTHLEEYKTTQGTTVYTDFLQSSTPSKSHTIGTALSRYPQCKICGENREAYGAYCRVHISYLQRAAKKGIPEAEWLKTQKPLGKVPLCEVPRCIHDAIFKIGTTKTFRVCNSHYYKFRSFAGAGKFEVTGNDWDDYCNTPSVIDSISTIQEARGTLDLSSCPESLQQQIRYALYRYTQLEVRSQWRPKSIQSAVDALADYGIKNLTDEEIAPLIWDGRLTTLQRRIVQVLPGLARTLIEERSSIRLKGLFDPSVVGGGNFVVHARTPTRVISYDLTAVSQTWLRNALWDHLETLSLLPDQKRPTSTMVYSRIGGVTLLSRLLSVVRLDSGNDPGILGSADGRSVGDELEASFDDGTAMVSHQARQDELRPLTRGTRNNYWIGMRLVLQDGIESGSLPESLNGFLLALPRFEASRAPAHPRPIDDATLQALMDPTNVQLLDKLDPTDWGLADIWLTHLLQGGRIGETLNLRLGSVGLIGNHQPYIWRDITKAGVLDYGMPCHPSVYERLILRKEKTLSLLRRRYHRELSARAPNEQVKLLRQWDTEMPLFPGKLKNPDLVRSVPYSSFRTVWSTWLDSLKIVGLTTHRTRATMATSLLNNGAPPDLVRQVLGHFSHESLAHYARYNDSNMIEQLRRVWAAGPGMPIAGQILLQDGASLGMRTSSGPSPIDLSAVSSEHGLCSYSPVVGGGDCPWQLKCTSDPSDVCEHFILTGADLTYWERKIEAAYTLAEGAESPEVREFIYSQWEKWGVVVSNLREALRAAGLLQAAEEQSLRLPRTSYLHPIHTQGWSFTSLADIYPRDTGD